MKCIFCKICEERIAILNRKYFAWLEAQSNNVALMEREADPQLIYQAYALQESDLARHVGGDEAAHLRDGFAHRLQPGVAQAAPDRFVLHGLAHHRIDAFANAVRRAAMPPAVCDRYKLILNIAQINTVMEAIVAANYRTLLYTLPAMTRVS